MNQPSATSEVGNPFLAKLLSLQQDGSGAISAPSNWLSEPLLRVETDTLARVRDFAREIVEGKTPSWLVLVGGPGNGKSMAVRELVNSLLARQLVVQDEFGAALADLAGKPVPAVLEVLTSDGSLLARIAQDASVVPYPYASNPNPAEDFRQLLDRCIQDGCHLVVCANRGVLEAAAALESNLGPDDARYKLLQLMAAAGQGATPAEEVAKESGSVQLFVRAMDAGSLFAGDDPVFLQLLEQATDPVHWRACKECSVATTCPFFLNMKELVHSEGKARMARLLEDAELLDGQPLVFREAGALVSLVLAGCAADYDGQSPCDWVERAVDEEAWFLLAARRTHMLLFSAPHPLGIDRPEDLSSLHSLCENSDLSADRLLRHAPSTRVGVSRLLGSQGVMGLLDPLAAPLDRELGVWEDGFIGELDPGTGLEGECQKVWDHLDTASPETQPDAADGLVALARWRSAHSVRYGALHKGLHAWRTELDGYRRAIGIPARPALRERAQLTAMLREVLDSDDGIRVGTNVRVVASTAGEVEVAWDASCARRSICITLGDSKEVLAQVPASVFVWLRRRHDDPLHDGTFPSIWLNSARDAIARAASASGYSRRSSGEMIVEDGHKRVALLWDSGEVDTEVLNDA